MTLEHLSYSVDGEIYDYDFPEDRLTFFAQDRNKGPSPIEIRDPAAKSDHLDMIFTALQDKYGDRWD